MKQTIFLIGVMLFFSIRSVADPFWGVLLYYGIAVFRPHAIWQWALPPGVRWSFYAAVVAIVAAAMHATSLGRPAVHRRFLIMVVLFGACVAASCVSALDTEVAAEEGWELGKIVIMLVVSYFVITEKRHLRYLAWMVFLSLTYLVFEMHMLYLLQGRLDIYHYGYGGLDNNGAALLLAMVIPFCYFFFLAERRWWRWGYLLCAIPAANMIMLSYSRGAMLSAVLAGAAMVLTTVRRRLRTACLAVVLALAVLWLAGPSVRDRFGTIGGAETDRSAQSRFQSWRAAGAIIQDYPLFGTGPGNALLLSHDYGADVEGRAIHSVYLEMGADSGLPAMLLYGGLMLHALWWFHRGSREVKGSLHHREDRWHYYICKAGFWSLVTFLVGAVFLSLQQFELPYLLVVMGAAAPALGAHTGDARRSPQLEETAITEETRRRGALAGKAD